MRIFIIAAVTADGFIGRDAQHTADWTGAEDKKIFVRLTKEAGVVVMGYRTFAGIGRALPRRRTIVYTHNPELIAETAAEATAEDPAELLKRLEREGVQSVAICGGTSIYDLLIRAGLVHELYITVAPLLFGTGLSLFSDSLDVRLQLLETTPLKDGAVLLHYAVKK
jgi:dihydrofolate reductase